MKNIIKYPAQNTWETLLQRPTLEKKDLKNTVQEIFLKVKNEGDSALKEFSEKFDQVSIENLLVSEKEIEFAINEVSKELKTAINHAKENIYKFHVAQKELSQEIETAKGVVCWRESRAIEKVGLYIPGGTAPLFSTVLMLGIPAQISGCKEVILCTPPQKDGSINSAILYTAQLCGITKIFKVGGAQAIAALTFGTETISKVDKIFGPGNQFVTQAKQLAMEYNVAIDLPAGPSEVLVIADKTANPEFCAADLLSQAEHGTDSQVVFISTDEITFNETLNEIEKQLIVLPRNDIAKLALENSLCILLKSVDEALEMCNFYAPEHLILSVENPRSYISKITNAGSIFLGNYTPESAGDYASGTNHTLPTNGFAKNYSGVSLDSFVKKITIQEISKIGLQNIGKTIEIMAEAEGLTAHKNAVSLRLKSLQNGI
ncbi:MULTISPECIES: histidinol dehydrogenase [unclassified Kaistella]|uniref:histidinol dehydrogenase n=1 Tax=unclassified Kaistella TaxID=2762626 RepID=UPI002734B344|nr:MULTISPECIES: histidinol dehydrogenase [unclassified Kaistella]MDP2454778.1 histidinol dehydrogenase [Kaistella sp. SH11-4b]MDP2457515.1 histidinol dehydrogenase [Kaistella sp. SH40-3]MDP2460275.1 histidinol dehydrogenase [Kaistella sp. SH19-2b]